MAFRHGNHGTLTNKSVIWKCPTCGQENAGALEAGCTNCKAGADARKAQATPSPNAQAAWWETVKSFLPPTDAAFASWINTQPGMDTAGYEIAKRAFNAGAAWATGNREPLPPPLLASSKDSRRGYCLIITPRDPDAEAVENSPVVDVRTHSTILAALAFYRDNQLAYGAVPGQLDAAEVSDLIEKLTPQEVEA